MKVKKDARSGNIAVKTLSEWDWGGLYWLI